MKKLLLPIAAAAAFSMNADAALLKLEFSGTLRDITNSDSTFITNGLQDGADITGSFTIGGPVPDDISIYSYEGNFRGQYNWIETKVDQFNVRLDQARTIYPYGFEQDQFKLIDDTPDKLLISDVFKTYPAESINSGCAPRNSFCSFFELLSITGSGPAPLPLNPFSDSNFPDDLSSFMGTNLLGQPGSARLKFDIFDRLIGSTGDARAAGYITVDTLTVAPVPLPAGVWLFMTAIAGGLAYRRKALKK